MSETNFNYPIQRIEIPYCPPINILGEFLDDTEDCSCMDCAEQGGPDVDSFKEYYD